MDTAEKLRLLVKWLDEKNAKNTISVKVSKLTTSTDYFVFTTALNERNAKALCDHLEEKMSKEDLTVSGKEGYDKGRWILLDLSDVIVNIFVEEERTLYNLEKLWSCGVFIEPGELINDDTV